MPTSFQASKRTKKIVVEVETMRTLSSMKHMLKEIQELQIARLDSSPSFVRNARFDSLETIDRDGSIENRSDCKQFPAQVQNMFSNASTRERGFMVTPDDLLNTTLSTRAITEHKNSIAWK